MALPLGVGLLSFLLALYRQLTRASLLISDPSWVILQGMEQAGTKLQCQWSLTTIIPITMLITSKSTWMYTEDIEQGRKKTLQYSGPQR